MSEWVSHTPVAIVTEFYCFLQGMRWEWRKSLTSEHILQYITDRCQHSDRCDKLSVFGVRMKTTFVVCEWMRQIAAVIVTSDVRLAFSCWGEVPCDFLRLKKHLSIHHIIWKSPPIAHEKAPLTYAIISLKMKPTPSPFTIYWVKLRLPLPRNTLHFWMSSYLWSHIITTSVCHLCTTIVQYSTTRRQHS